MNTSMMMTISFVISISLSMDDAGIYDEQQQKIQAQIQGLHNQMEMNQREIMRMYALHQQQPLLFPFVSPFPLPHQQQQTPAVIQPLTPQQSTSQLSTTLIQRLQKTQRCKLELSTNQFLRAHFDIMNHQSLKDRSSAFLQRFEVFIQHQMDCC